jgi:uncharacterized repeat protein (TIGR03803 family)
LRNATGDIYGTATSGGVYGGCIDGLGCGVVFKLDTAGNETVIHAFTGGADGAYPLGGLTAGSGSMYGAAANGGDRTTSRCGNGHGCGTVFRINLTVHTVRQTPMISGLRLLDPRSVAK